MLLIKSHMSSNPNFGGAGAGSGSRGGAWPQGRPEADSPVRVQERVSVVGPAARSSGPALVRLWSGSGPALVRLCEDGRFYPPDRRL